MHEGKHGILDGVEDMDDVFGTKADHHDHDHDHDHEGHHAHRHFTGIVEAGCGLCIFGMKGLEDCALAVKIDGKPYLVGDSVKLDHKDAHEAQGICNVVRRAVVDGSIEGERFVASRFTLLPFKK